LGIRYNDYGGKMIIQIRGGVYLEGGEVSREFNKHKTKKDWSETWQSLTME